MKNVYELLDNLNIKYAKIKHEALYTVTDALQIKDKIEGIGCKNLFLKNKDNYYLVLIKDDKMADLKYLSNLLQIGKLHFASSEELKEILNLEKGSVTPLGLINDLDNKVLLLIDKDLENKKLLMHPNINTETISLSYSDLIKIIKYLNHKYILF